MSSSPFTLPFTSPDLPSILLATSIFLASYLTFLSFTPPNPQPTGPTAPPDSLRWATSPPFLFLRRALVIGPGTYHSLICLYYPSIPSTLCPHPENLNPSLFTWNPWSAFWLLAILLSTSFRLLAFAQLGTNFTFRLSTPKSLVTTGLYRYVQHPSYTATILIVTANTFLLERQDGIMACWTPAWIVHARWFWAAMLVYVVGMASRFLWMRIRDEEAMLKRTFGKEWEVYHAKTKRFVPWVF